MESDRVQLAHGGGGTRMRQLLEQLVLPTFGSPLLAAEHDAAVFSVAPGGPRLAFTTDTYVVRPLFFPGGDIGRLAVNGTVNDLAMAGARPLVLSVGLVLEEGLPMADLARVLASMAAAARAAGVSIATGDTKAVERGHADGLFINTAGIGLLDQDLAIMPQSVRPGDAVLVNGDLARHGMAVMAAREEFHFESAIESDTAPLTGLVQALLAEGIALHCLRDLTRGGLASALVEIAATANVAVEIDESRLPVQPAVQAACELLGLDPIHVACEGRLVAFVPAQEAARTLAVMRAHSSGTEPVVIGSVVESGAGRVTLRGRIGVPRLLEMLSGDQLPRIC